MPGGMSRSSAITAGALVTWPDSAGQGGAEEPALPADSSDTSLPSVRETEVERKSQRQSPLPAVCQRIPAAPARISERVPAHGADRHRLLQKHRTHLRLC